MNQDIQSVVSTSFLKATYNCYWHYIVKNYREKSFYEKRDHLTQKISEIAKKLGENSFERREVSGLTPLHVAVLTGNREGVLFLLEKEVSLHIKDNHNCTPLDYAKKYSKELLDLFPSELLVPVQQELSEIFKKWHVPLEQAPCEYKEHTQDFGVEIKEILISSKYEDHIRNLPNEQIRVLQGKLGLDVLFEHLAEVMSTLGVHVIRTQYPYAVRDQFFKLPNGEFRKQCLSDTIDKAYKKARSLGFYFNEVGYTRTNHPFFPSDTGVAKTLAKRATHEMMNLFSNPPELKGQIEGGNGLILTNRPGRPQILLGREHFYTSLNYHRLNKTVIVPSENDDLVKIKQQISQDLTSEKIYNTAEKMYAQGLLKINGAIGLVEPDTMKEIYRKATAKKLSFDAEGNEHTLKRLAIEQEILKPFSLQQSQIEACRNSVINYLFQKYAIEKLIAVDLGVEPADIHIISQAMYHLDLFLKSGPKRSVFVASFAMNCDIINMLLKNADLLNLSVTDINLLNRYLKMSEKLDRELSPLLQQAHEKIGHAQLTAIPMPAIFFDDPETLDKTFNFNLMNALTGWSSKTKRYYYITSGVHAGDRLGEIFMEIFTQFLKAYENELDVFYIGGSKENRKDFSKTMVLWNDPNVQAGIHCFSLETKTATHIG